MKMTYKNLNVSELEKSLESLLPGTKEFKVELSEDGDGPTIVCMEVMSLENILALVEKQGFKVNDFTGVYSGGGMRDCIGITLKKPFIHDETKESIEGLFILGNLSDETEKEYLFSFLFEAVKSHSDIQFCIKFSVDIVAKDEAAAQSSLIEKIASFEYPSKEEIRIRPITYEDGDWVEMEPVEDPGEIRFSFEDLTLEQINELF
ncbi:hypothetical protein ACQKML_24415 [Peribacillus frigoritolerans]